MNFYVSETLSTRQASRWDEHRLSTPARNYMQAPVWAEIEHCDDAFEVRRPFFFWCEDGGELALARART
jgi:hypothetical protein